MIRLVVIRFILLRFVLLGFVCLAPVVAQPVLSPTQVAQIRDLARAELERTGVPGLSIAVGLDNQLVWEQGFGLADVEHNVPAHAHTLYRTASIAKPMTATALLQLAEDGRLDLDAPIQRYVPEFSRKHKLVTARMILGHLSGIRHYIGDEFASTRHYETLTEAITVFKDDDLLFDPGEKYSYTTYGFNLLGVAVERVAETDYMTYMLEHVFGPAGMTRTVADNHFQIIPNRTRFYRRVGDERRLENAGMADTSVKIPGGGLLSTPGDLLRFAAAVNTGKLLRPATVAEAFIAQKLNNGETGRTGLGWAVSELEPGVPQIGHGGGQQGTSTNLTFLPEEGVIVAVMTNLESYPELPGLVQTLLEILR